MDNNSITFGVVNLIADIAFFIVKIFVLLIIIVALFGVWEFANSGVAKDQKDFDRYTYLLETQNSENFQDAKRNYVYWNCHALGGTDTGMTCVGARYISNSEYLNSIFDVDGINERIQERNDSYKQWKWFGQDPITTY